MTTSILSLRQRLRLGAGQSAKAWQRRLAHLVRDHFDDLEEHVRVGFRYAQILPEIEAVLLEQFSVELDRREKATNKRLSIDPKDQAALAQLAAIAEYRQNPPLQPINLRSFGEEMYRERKRRKKAGTYHFSGKRIVLPGVRAPQLFVDFDEEEDVPLKTDEPDVLPTIPGGSPALPSSEHGSSPQSSGERPDPDTKAAATKSQPQKMPAPANAAPVSTRTRSRPPVAPRPDLQQAMTAGKPTVPSSDSGASPSAPNPARNPALPATEAPGSTGRTSALAQRPSGPRILDFDE